MTCHTCHKFYCTCQEDGTISELTWQRDQLLEIANNYRLCTSIGFPGCQRGLVDNCKCKACTDNRLDAITKDIT